MIVPPRPTLRPTPRRLRYVVTWVAALLHLAGCGLESQGEQSGGVEPAVHGFAVVNSDYQSVSVSLASFDGKVLSETFIASGSADTGLSAALGGDVVLPSEPPASGEVVLIDRTPTGVLTWVERSTGKVRAQLNVGTGFAANPHDYVELTPTKAFVPRFGWNLASGEEPFDRGNDVLVIDPSVPAIVSSIDLMPALADEPDGFFPCADRAILVGAKLYVLAVGFNTDFSDGVESRLVTIDPTRDEIQGVFVIEGMHSCSALDRSPTGETLVVACNGAFGQSHDSGYPDSGLVLIDLSDEPHELGRFPAARLGGEMLSAVAFVDETSVLFTTYGRYANDLTRMAAPDTARLLDLTTGKLVGEPLVRSNYEPFTLGAVGCAPAERTCVLADAETDGGVLHYFRLGDAAMEHDVPIRLDRTLGLPPRYVTRF